MTASCLCGSIEYHLSGRPINFNLCHCTMCRKFHGAAFGPYVRLKSENFNITKGNEYETVYKSSEWASRSFCKKCGSSLRYIYHKEPEVIFIAAGIIDGDPGIKPKQHIFTKDKCAWYEIKDEIPQIQEY
jgi:hypothetical protein